MNLFWTFSPVQGPGFLKQQGREGQLPPDLIWKALGSRWSRPLADVSLDGLWEGLVKLHPHARGSPELTTLSEKPLVGLVLRHLPRSPPLMSSIRLCS